MKHTFCIVAAILITAELTGAQPPPQPAINPAEFEPMSGVIIAYPPPLPMSLVAEISEDANVLSVVPDAGLIQPAINAYGNNGVNLDNCTFLICPASANLVRDNGPWYIFNGLDVQGIVDNINNAGTVNDSLPIYIGDSLNIPVYQTGLVIQGGNWMSDGMGGAMCSGMIYRQNPNYTQTRIHNILQSQLGIENCLVLDDFGSWGDVHIDTWGKFLDPGRVLIERYPSPVPELEALAHYISTLKSSYGRPYEVIRIDNDWPTAYTNSLFLNNKILVPFFNNPYDSIALRTLQEAMPGYEVLGFANGGWGSGNALHCRTMGITDRYMLRITHIPIFDQENYGQDYPVHATVHAYSDTPLLPGMPQLFWKVEGGDYTIVPMTQTVGDTFSASVPSQPDNTDIYYYIHAEDDSNRSENHPYIGAGNPHHFFVGPDTEPPTIETEIPSSLLPLSLPLWIVAEVRDNRWITSVSLEYLINGSPYDTLDMILQPLSAALYEAEFDPPVTVGDRVQLRIKAVDNSINQNSSYSPENGYYEIAVVGDLRTCVWNPCGQPSGEALYDLIQSFGIQSFYTEDEPLSFNRFTCMFICLGVSPCAYMLNLTQVDKISAYIQSGHGVYLEGADAWAYGPYQEELSRAFGIIGLWDGPYQQSINPLLGVQGTFTAGMSFNSSNTCYVDRIAPSPGSELLFVHADSGFGVAQETLDYKTVGLSFELGGLTGNNPASSQEFLLRQILSFFRGSPLELAGIGLGEEDVPPATQYTLEAVYPNPFNAATTIRFGLPEAAYVTLEIYDITGRLVESPLQDWRDAGVHEVTFDGSGLASGVYLYRLETSGSGPEGGLSSTTPTTETGKMVLMK